MHSKIIFPAKRILTREVKVGSVGIGGNNPIRIQSMTTTATKDVAATVEQIMQLADLGCEIVRITVQGMKEAESSEQIKNILVQKGYFIPVVADIHFYPPAALRVVEFVDKVRINPGNFVDKRAQFKLIEYDDESYAKELEKIYESFAPLVIKCKNLGKALRIGTNHGSLSDRIMNRFGDSPKGMVESAFEFARVARSLDFHDMIFSMKASNPKVMIEAYRHLVKQMQILGWDYPIHLGVTESGQGEDGRIKSSLGIGTLLLEGIGDTIRVSLTEDPHHELLPARRLVALAQRKSKVQASCLPLSREKSFIATLHRNPVMAYACEEQILAPSFFAQIDIHNKDGKIHKGDKACDGIVLCSDVKSELAKERIALLAKESIPTFILPDIVTQKLGLGDVCSFGSQGAYSGVIATGLKGDPLEIQRKNPSLIFLFCPEIDLSQVKAFIGSLSSLSVTAPIILVAKDLSSFDEVLIQASVECGSLLLEGCVDGLALDLSASLPQKLSLSFGIMQAARLRAVKTEFISCPGCGRTLFDLQEVSSRIERKTSHLPGVKIAIMGCIVNGPGEMADADFGYVGSRPGKIDLYVGKECVEKNIDMNVADEKLIELIRSKGLWRDEPKRDDVVSNYS